jgi:hypothetical protein
MELGGCVMEISTIVLALALAQHPAMPAGMSHEEHQKQMARDAELKKRGDAAMGFDQDATTHHFLITDDGGVIQVTVNDARDTANRDAIRAHLEKVAQDFSSGVFDSPFATHGEVPPGVPTMQQRKSSITYRYEAVDGGARVRIVASDPQAVAAVKEFLRYQIREHKTGDPGVR